MRHWLNGPRRSPPGGHPSETVGEGNMAFLISSLDGETRFRRRPRLLACVPAMMPAHTLLPFRRTRP
ncbi:hypothetical protein IP79_10990 [Porphyrobacter sp. AAP60]|nr:hypothetical protein IP79_10990 [Porphyrobacter sp. AAP60]